MKYFNPYNYANIYSSNKFYSLKDILRHFTFYDSFITISHFYMLYMKKEVNTEICTDVNCEFLHEYEPINIDWDWGNSRPPLLKTLQSPRKHRNFPLFGDH